jgi:uncharacterized membrane protein (DUF485 family)
MCAYLNVTVLRLCFTCSNTCLMLLSLLFLFIYLVYSSLIACVYPGHTPILSTGTIGAHVQCAWVVRNARLFTQAKMLPG